MTDTEKNVLIDVSSKELPKEIINEQQINELTKLGYTREDGIPALEFSSGNISKAVLYLQGKTDCVDM